MKNKILFTSLLALVVGGILFSSCKKDENEIINNYTSAKDNSTAENMFDDVFKVANDVASDQDGYAKSKSSRIYFFGNITDTVEITITPAELDSFPKNITINFGNTGVHGYDQRTRKGVIEFTITDRYLNEGSVITVTPKDYYINDYKVEGTKIITNNGRNTSDNLNYTIEVKSGKVTDSEDKTITWNSTRNREWIAGEETTWADGLIGVTDDIYSIAGSANGKNRNGKNFKVQIKEALIVQVGCNWIKKGVVEIAPEGLSARRIDYGNGDCDANATITIGEDLEFDIIML